MRKLYPILTLLFLAQSASANINGSWTAVPKDDGRLHLGLAYDSSSHSSSNYTLSDFAGLTDAQLHAGAQTPVQFEMRREAGTISFEGTFKNSFGAGQFTFAPSKSYFATIRGLGIKVGEDDDDEKLFALAMQDVSTAYIKSMIAAGYRVDLDQYLAFRIFRVTPELVAEYRALGFRAMSADDLVTAQIHKVTPKFISRIRELGFRDVDFNDLVAFRIHGVTAELIADIRELGYADVKAEQLVAMRIHRVTPEYIREIAAAGYSHVPIDKLVAMRIHDIDAAYVKKMNRM